MKTCARCKQLLPYDSFPPNSRLKSGLHSYCHPCRKAKNADRAKNTRSTTRAHKPCTSCERTLNVSKFMSNVNSSDGLRSRCRDCSSSYQTLRKYKLTPEQYAELVKNGCHICGTHDRLHVDHDHTCCPGQTTCGKCVRGILCEKHNQGLGCFQDDRDSLRAAIEYLNAH